MKPHQQLQSLHRTLHTASLIVPRAQRAAWQAEWIAELSYLLRSHPASASDCAQGLFSDAFAMRRLSVVNRWRAIDWRSPELCLRTLVGIFALLLTVDTSQPHIRHILFSDWGLLTFAAFALLAVLTVPSTVVVSRFSAREAYQGEAASMRQRSARWGFLTAKLLLLVCINYLLTVQITRPIAFLIGKQADFFLILLGLFFNVVFIGWAFNDQRQRCPTCMRSLRSPARMGPPSWSLLDSNATEEMCDRGHGLLHQPEWQTSWYGNARWLQLDRTWRGLFRP